MATELVSVSLTNNDHRVLNALFDPESSLSQLGAVVDDTRYSLPQFNSDELRALREKEANIIKDIQSSEPSREAVKQAIAALDELIATSVSYAPAYSNRAQARRLVLHQRNYTSATDSTAILLIYADLSEAIRLVSPSSASIPVSALQAQLLSSTHTHRAYLVHMANKSGNTNSLPQPLCSKGKEAMEDMASRDFYMGGMYGDEKAKQMSVATNPYAKMCGAIVKEALMNEVETSFEFNR